MAFRNLLVIFQFAVSIALIISSAVIYFQRSYITSMDLGYDAENIMMVHGTGRDTVRPKNKMLREEIKKIPGVINASYTFTLPGVREEGGGFVMVPDISGEQKIMIQTRWIDEDYLDTYKVQLLAGREYDRNNTADQYPNQNAFDNYTHPLQHNLLINEAAIQYLGLGNTPEEALGKVIRFGVERYVDFTVIGVTANVQHHSLRDSIRPEIHPMINGDWGGFMAVRMQGDPRPVQAAIEKFWREKVSDVPFVYSYAQDRMEEDFKKEEAMASMMTVASVLAIFVACMGLFGLASFAAERRTKEIGVRKVMGAQVRDIVGLLIWQFSKPVIMASMVAWPLTCYGLIQWLNGFPYRIDYWWFIPLCLISGLIALLIAWGTVGGNAAKVARSNPIKALRYE